MRLRPAVLLLAVMWAFGTWHGGHAALTHFQDRATAVDLVQPALPVIAALQEERRLTAMALAGSGAAGARDRLAAGRADTDRLADALRRSAGRARVGWSRPRAAGDAARLLERLAALDGTRAGVDARSVDRRSALDAYTAAGDAALRLVDTPWPRADAAADERRRALAGLVRAGELLAREDTLVSAAPGGLPDADRAELARLAGARRLLYAGAGLPEPTAAEDALLAGAASEAAAWRTAVDASLAAVREATSAGVRHEARAAAPAGVSAVAQAGLFGGLGLVAVLAAYARARRRGAPAAEQPGLRDGTAELLLRLTRRNQALLHRQLAVLDDLQRRERDDAGLAALFRADHLAAQLRRNVEKAIIVAGHEPGRRWRRPVPVVDVARAAAASVERYVAVMVASVDAAALAGPAVGDVTHLLTELVDNATRYAPGDATVWVTGELGLTAYTVIVQDRGPGMAAAELAAARDALARPYRPSPAGGPAPSGLRLAGRLARAHDIEVELDEAPRGGIVARVRIPLALIVTADDPDLPPDALDVPDAPARPAGPAGDLPTRVPGPVPAAVPGFPRRRPDGPPVDRTARFRDRLAARTARAAGPPGAADRPTVELPVQRSTVDEDPRP